MVIADFGPPTPQVEARLSQLQGHARRGRVLIIMLTHWDDVAIRLIRAGAAGVLFSDADAPDVRLALDTIADQRTYLPPTLQQTLAQRFVAGADATLDRLTRRELEFVRRLAVGASTSEIAEELGLSSKTADTHRANVLRKLGLRNNVDVARLALQHGLVAL
ncbi:response regulator transcription factor [Caulobacter sp. SL161]|uniref:response regulator transcription factor n=1 Tax=Caulobacter sp. SL161 TaxID=2995156 RepID=UPI002275A453|nr:response regulator transcription factor [Caulobacter sp. SL161]MCY1649201.1 response regulator transcription factor [Caulobacter sp. SL161]